MADNAENTDTTTLESALRKLQGVELTFDELEAVASAALGDDDVQGFGPRGVVNWDQVGKVAGIRIGDLGRAHSPQEDIVAKASRVETVPAEY